MIKAQGYRGLWRGLGSTLCRDVPFSGIYWTSYEGLKKAWDIQQNPSFSSSFMAGALSGCVSYYRIILIPIQFGVIYIAQLFYQIYGLIVDI